MISKTGMTYHPVRPHSLWHVGDPAVHQIMDALSVAVLLETDEVEVEWHVCAFLLVIAIVGHGLVHSAIDLRNQSPEIIEREYHLALHSLCLSLILTTDQPVADGGGNWSNPFGKMTNPKSLATLLSLSCAYTLTIGGGERAVGKHCLTSLAYKGSGVLRNVDNHVH